MSHITTERKKPKKDNPIKNFFAEFSLNLFVETILSIVWNVVLFIPRVIIRMISNIY